jgi:hypothetical protein
VTDIAEAYVHLKRIEITRERMTELGDIASRLAAEAASGIFPDSSIIEVHLAEGSLKTWIKVGTGLLGLYGLTADYSSFKQSVPEIVRDARTFGDLVINSFITMGHVEGAVVYRKERRTKTPGKILRLLKRREWYESRKNGIPPDARLKEAQTIEYMLQQILVEVDAADQKLVRDLLQGDDTVPALPTPEMPVVGLPHIYQQLQLGIDRNISRESSIPDYHRRFRLDDPSMTKIPLKRKTDGGGLALVPEG